MILGRRTPLSPYRRLRGWLWPHIGWRRAGRYLLMRIQRMPGTPHSIAAGFAAGAAVSFTPFFGAHFVLAFAIAWLTGGNMVAAALGTLVGNPWTFPLILAASYELGCFVLGMEPHGLRYLAHLDAGLLLERVRQLLWPMIVGSAPLAALAWIATYLGLVRAVAGLQERRRRRRAARLRAIAELASK